MESVNPTQSLMNGPVVVSFDRPQKKNTIKRLDGDEGVEEVFENVSVAVGRS
jgi:hypothetical protein